MDEDWGYASFRKLPCGIDRSSLRWRCSSSAWEAQKKVWIIEVSNWFGPEMVGKGHVQAWRSKTISGWTVCVGLDGHDEIWSTCFESTWSSNHPLQKLIWVGSQRIFRRMNRSNSTSLWVGKLLNGTGRKDWGLQFLCILEPCPTRWYS